MKKQEWNDDLEQLLKSMPTISDNRNPHEIYQNISSRVKKKKKKTWIMPSLATAFALLLFYMISPEIIDNFKSSNQESSQSNAVTDSSTEQAQLKMAEDPVMEPPAEGIDEKAEIALFDVAEDYTSYVVWEDMARNKTLLTYNVPHSSIQFMVPLSVLVDSEGKNPVELMNDYVSSVNGEIDQSDWNLEPFSTNFFEFSEETTGDGEKRVRANITESLNTEALTSAELDVFLGTLQSFRWFKPGYSDVDIYQNGEQNAVIGQTGLSLESYHLNQSVSSYHYYEVAEEKRGDFNQNKGFLVSTPTSFVPSPVDLKEALEQMENDVPLGEMITLQAPIKQDVSVQEIIENEKNVEIVFTNDSNLVDDEDGMMMIEAIMLTAKEFGYEAVTFRGEINRIGNINFGVETEVPLAPNPIRLQ